MSETQVVLELTGILVHQLVKCVGCLDLGQAREEQAWLQESHTMIFIEVQIAQVTHFVLYRADTCMFFHGKHFTLSQKRRSSFIETPLFS